MPKKASIEDRILAETAIDLMSGQDKLFEEKLKAESCDIEFCGLVITAEEARNIMTLFLQFGQHLMASQKTVTEAQFTHLLGDCLTPTKHISTTPQLN
jgi:hypothetical protein